MTAISPTRISLYDFLIEDTAPIDPIIADSGHISLPQASLLRHHGLQAVVCALLTYEQKYGANSVQKKLFHRTAVKELREYNAFNFVTMDKVLQYNTMAEVLFGNEKTLKSVCQKLADIADTSVHNARSVLSALSLIALRELAILADFAQLDDTDLSKWFGYQHQFMQLDRSAVFECHQHASPIADSAPVDDPDNTDVTSLPNTTLTVIDNYDSQWQDIVGYKVPQTVHSTKSYPQDNHTPNYAKAIGLMPDHDAEVVHEHGTAADASQASPTKPNHNIVAFMPLQGIALPHSRWLLQLGRIADIYLSRNRLKIASEPSTPPPRPLLTFGSTAKVATPTTPDSDAPIIYDAPDTPLWKNKTIYVTLTVIGVLGFLSFLKFQYQSLPSGAPSTMVSASQSSAQRPPSYDIAVMRVNEEDVDQAATLADEANLQANNSATDDGAIKDEVDNEQVTNVADNLLTDADANVSDGDGSNNDTLEIVTTSRINLITPTDDSSPNQTSQPNHSRDAQSDTPSNAHLSSSEANVAKNATSSSSNASSAPTATPTVDDSATTPTSITTPTQPTQQHADATSSITATSTTQMDEMTDKLTHDKAVATPASTTRANNNEPEDNKVIPTGDAPAINLVDPVDPIDLASTNAQSIPTNNSNHTLSDGKVEAVKVTEVDNSANSEATTQPSAVDAGTPATQDSNTNSEN